MRSKYIIIVLKNRLSLTIQSDRSFGRSVKIFFNVYCYRIPFLNKMESAEETARIVSGLPEAEEIIETEGPWSDRKDDEEEVSNVDDVDDDLQETSGVSAYGISAASGTNAAASKRGLPKLREIMRRQKQDSEVIFEIIPKISIKTIRHILRMKILQTLNMFTKTKTLLELKYLNCIRILRDQNFI